MAALDNEIKEKTIEISIMTDKKSNVKNEISNSLIEFEKTQDKLKVIKNKQKFVATNAREYDDNPEFKLPAPKSLMSAKTYYETFAVPLVKKLKDAIRKILVQYFEKTRQLQSALDRANKQIENLNRRINKLEPENDRLKGVERNYYRIERMVGKEQVDTIINKAVDQELILERTQKQRYLNRNRNLER